MKPTLKPPGTKHLKLKNNDPPSDFAFKFNLRRYNEALRIFHDRLISEPDKVGLCRLTQSNLC